MNADCRGRVEWAGLYKKDYDLCTPESFAHPAKASWDLAFKIIDHLQELGLLHESDTLLDPMAGTARFLIAAGAKGFRAVGLELEEKFCVMARDNVAYASKKLNRPLDITILQGDARNLSGLLEEKGLVGIVSPPYGEAVQGDGADAARKRIEEGRYKGKRPDVWTSPGNKAGGSYGDGYSDNPSNIGNLPDKPLKAIVSPPYAIPDTEATTEWMQKQKALGKLPTTAGGDHLRYDRKAGSSLGHTKGQIADLPDRIVTVTSPPYEDSKVRAVEEGIGGSWTTKGRRAHDNLAGYGSTDGQIGRRGENENQESYLDAMRLVYAEIGKVADVLAVVVKNPTRGGKLRRLDLDTIALLEATGWTIHCHHHALLFEEQEQAHLFDGVQKKVKGRMSFFKRLSWQKGKSEIASWEDVIIAVREGGGLKAVMSPPFLDADVDGARKMSEGYFNQVGGLRHTKTVPYGDTPGQIGKLK